MTNSADTLTCRSCSRYFDCEDAKKGERCERFDYEPGVDEWLEKKKPAQVARAGGGQGLG